MRLPTKALAICCAVGVRSSAPAWDRTVTLTPPKTWRRSAVKLEQSFEVAAPVERVWQALVDVEQVAPCLPGAAVTGRNDDGSYNGTFTVKIGPTTASYVGKLQMEQIDESAHTATMQATPPQAPAGAHPRPAEPAEPIQGLSLVGGAMLERIRRNPVPYAFVLGMLLAILLRGRRR